MSMVLGIMVSRSLLLLVGGVAGANERLGVSKQLERLRSSATSWRGGEDGLLVECDGGNYCWSEEGRGFSRLFKGRVALALDPALKRLRWLL
jgi:hypothetical protein